MLALSWWMQCYRMTSYPAFVCDKIVFQNLLGCFGKSMQTIKLSGCLVWHNSGANTVIQTTVLFRLALSSSIS